jgi:prevent-host-death family protein
MVHNSAMEISVSDAKGRLTDLVRRAEAGDEVVLTRHGRPTAKLVPIREIPAEPGRRRTIIDGIVRRARSRRTAGEDAASSQDFLYGEDTGLPE